VKSPRHGTPILVGSALLLTVAAFPGIAASDRQHGRVSVQSRYPGPRLTTVYGRPVFASMLNRQTRTEVCPRLTLPITRKTIRQAAIVVTRALPALLAHSHRAGTPTVDATGAKTTALPASRAHSGEDFRRFCGTGIWVQTIFVMARLPKVKASASLSILSFVIADTRRGWIIWGEVH
jgi:hypothetical protein